MREGEREDYFATMILSKYFPSLAILTRSFTFTHNSSITFSDVKMKNFHLISHPLIERDVAILRNIKTRAELFRTTLHRLTILIAYEVTKNISVREITIRTPLEKCAGKEVGEEIILVPVLRAGLGMLDGFLSVLPEAKVGHVGLYRNEETLEPVKYYTKYPAHVKNASVFILDPMLATGGSAEACIQLIAELEPRRISLVSLVAAPEGVHRVRKSFRNVSIYTAALDRELNAKGYILPGLGDAGDRIFGTN